MTEQEVFEVRGLISEEGISMREAAKRLGHKRSTVNEYLMKPEYIGHYARAREDREDIYFEQIRLISEEKAGEVVDEAGNVRLDSGFQQRQKMRIDAIKWMLARMNPKKYGDRIETVITEGKNLPDWRKEGDE